MSSTSGLPRRVLCLGPPRSQVDEVIVAAGDRVMGWIDGPLTADAPVVVEANMLLSFGYRHILREDVLSLFVGSAFNIHFSYLPWNRGADPNLWSFLDDTPRGVTIHLLSAGLDKGDIVAQREVAAGQDDTLRTSYARLERAAVDLLCNTWRLLRSGQFRAIPQVGRGSYHRTADRARVEHLLHAGWDTPVRDLIGRGSSR